MQSNKEVHNNKHLTLFFCQFDFLTILEAVVYAAVSLYLGQNIFQLL